MTYIQNPIVFSQLKAGINHCVQREEEILINAHHSLLVLRCQERDYGSLGFGIDYFSFICYHQMSDH